MFKVIIFDFFDVIRTDAFKVWLKANGYTLEGAFLNAVQSVDRGDITTDEFLAILTHLTGKSAAVIFDGMEADASINTDVLFLIERLKHTYKIGLLSNAPSAFLRGILKEHDLEKYFDTIVISSEVGFIKPTPEIFNHILSKMDATPAEALFIDDTSKNVDGATAVGITSLLYKDVPTLEHDLRTNNIHIS
jgi:HAD superfamily hydrolase (TIGR01509 family)